MQKTTCIADECQRASWARGLCTTHLERLRRHGTLDPIPPKFDSLEHRFWSKVKKTETCWEWQAALVQGYGHFFTKADGKSKANKAHRMAYEFIVGPIPAGLDIDHICHNTACVNPEHLRPTTRKQNMENRSGPNAGSKSGYRGVHWNSAAQKWVVVVGHNGKQHRGGYFTDPHEAGTVAQRMRLELFTHSNADHAA